MSLLLFLAAATAPVDHPRTYLLSIEGMSLRRDERIVAFSLSTWGVRFGAVCHLPVGWTIKAGSSLTPEGVLQGEGSLGSTWFMSGTPQELQGFVLVTLYAPVQRADIRVPNGVVPATFKGKATLWLDDDKERKVPLTYRNLRLVPARRCPAG